MYQRNMQILSSDVTLSDRLRLSSLFKLTQDATALHMDEIDLGRGKTIDKGFLWVILRQCANIYDLPKYSDKVVIESWPGEMRHAFFPRYNRMLDNKGNILCTVSALWALIDCNTRHLTTPKENGIIVPCEITGNEFDLPCAIKKIETSKSIELEVPYSYCDINGHLSNLRYLDIAEDCIEDVASSKMPRSVKCEYNSEIKYKEKVTISYGNDGDKWYFSGDGDKHKFSLVLDYTC